MGESWGKRESVWERCEYVCARENIYVSASREAEIYVCACAGGESDPAESG